jgi:5'-nucleotidase
MKNLQNVALFDMDGTLCDHDLGLFVEMEKLRSPTELPVKSLAERRLPNYLINRANLIRQQESWWENLPRLKLGWDVLKVAQQLGFKIMILTQGPKSKPQGWSGKIKWLSKNLPGVDVTITRDKGLVYGKVLVDDFPGYIERWLEHRKRGLVIMPVNEFNKDFKHSNVIRYDGKNLREVREALKKVLKRKPDEPLIL